MKSFNQFLEETSSHQSGTDQIPLTMMPPAVLTLSRDAIRMYPNNLQVALYYAKQINRYFTVLFTNSP